ncbi:hypothetical protein [Serratia marcescens]|uniref:hypothetical protein n=1 Tax=Serratia marcescens TaxID=615 RepID=UPI0012B6DAAB|nr:hypothetical protein [Serratia marcescens]
MAVSNESGTRPQSVVVLLAKVKSVENELNEAPRKTLGKFTSKNLIPVGPSRGREVIASLTPGRGSRVCVYVFIYINGCHFNPISHLYANKKAASMAACYTILI